MSTESNKSNGFAHHDTAEFRSSNRIEDYPRWAPIDPIELSEIKIDVLYRIILPLARKMKYDIRAVKHDPERFLFVIDMVEKRKIYFHIFHSDIESPMGELNELCLYVYWILKFRPFYYTIDPGNDISFNLSLMLFTQGLFYIIKKQKKKGVWTKDLNQIFTIDSFEHILHSFKFHDISKEAIMLLAEAMLGDH
jgi:hypothetical protein